MGSILGRIFNVFNIRLIIRRRDDHENIGDTGQDPVDEAAGRGQVIFAFVARPFRRGDVQRRRFDGDGGDAPHFGGDGGDAPHFGGNTRS